MTIVLLLLLFPLLAPPPFTSPSIRRHTRHDWLVGRIVHNVVCLLIKHVQLSCLTFLSPGLCLICVWCAGRFLGVATAVYTAFCLSSFYARRRCVQRHNLEMLILEGALVDPYVRSQLLVTSPSTWTKWAAHHLNVIMRRPPIIEEGHIDQPGVEEQEKIKRKV